MCKLAVSLLEMDYGHLEQALREIESAGAQGVHIDVMDGRFVPNLGIGPKLVQAIRPASKLNFDIHMMVEEPGRFLEKMKMVGADSITIHYEACENIHREIARIRSLGLKAGVGLKPDTPLEALDEELLRMVDVVHLMTTYPGYENQRFIPTSLERIACLRSMLNQTNVKCDIEVDGNITMENIAPVVEAGASVIVSGRAVVQGNVMENILRMRELIESVEGGKIA